MWGAHALFLSREPCEIGPLQADGLSEEQRKVLAIMEKTFSCYITEDPKAKVC